MTATTSLALSLALASTAPAGVPTADQIFEHAKRVLAAQSYPDPILYRTTIHVSEGAKDELEHFHGEAFSGGDVRVEGVSDEEQAAPHESRGVNFRLAFSIAWNSGSGGQTGTATEDAHRKEALPDYLGVPLVSPIYSFGLTSQRSDTQMHNPEPADTLRTIATVTAIDRPYKVSLVATEPLGGFYAYHLRLEPTSHPERHRIRELWIDVYTYQILQLQTQGNFTGAPMSNVPWLVTFQDVAGSLYIKDETTLEPLIFRHDRTFSTAQISFDEIRAAESSPPILPALDDHTAIDLREP